MEESMTGSELKKRRRAKKISRQQLAVLIGMSKRTVEGYERGRKIPGNSLKLIEMVLGKN
jgi:DNA-binding transcriptional regulator YiaG